MFKPPSYHNSYQEFEYNLLVGYSNLKKSSCLLFFFGLLSWAKLYWIMTRSNLRSCFEYVKVNRTWCSYVQEGNGWGIEMLHLPVGSCYTDTWPPVNFNINIVSCPFPACANAIYHLHRMFNLVSALYAVDRRNSENNFSIVQGQSLILVIGTQPKYLKHID